MRLPSKRAGILFLSVLLLALIFTWVGWWFSPPRMRLVKRIQLPKDTILGRSGGNEPLLFGASDALLLTQTWPSNRPKAMSTVSLLGWDGQPCWQFTYPKRIVSPGNCGMRAWGANGWADVLTALSPDHHIFAIASLGGSSFLLESWRDGHMLGRVRLQYTSPPHSGCSAFCLRAHNSGRIRLYEKHYYRNASQLWVINGSHVASGRYKPSKPVSHGEVMLSLDGSSLLCLFKDGSKAHAETASVEVLGDKVLFTPLNNHASSAVLASYDDELYKFERCFGTVYTPDGKTMVTRESGHRMVRYIRSLPYVSSWLWLHESDPPMWLSVYTAPFKLGSYETVRPRAIHRIPRFLPPSPDSNFNYIMLSDFIPSIDGHKVAEIYQVSNNEDPSRPLVPSQEMIEIYRW